MSVVYGTKFLIAKSRWLTITGVTAGIIVNILDASDNILLSAKATSNTIKFDLMGFEAPLSIKLQAFGTDGVELIKTAVQEVFHGDTWAYSGDTTSSAAMPKRIITNLHMAGGY